MILRKWDDLPDKMKNENVRRYYDALQKKKFSLLVKRVFDIIFGILILIVISPFLLIIGVVIKIDSKGPILFRQVRVTQYGKRFHIYKFRTMVNNAEKIGAQITAKDDNRITKVGRVLRKYRLDEFPQVFNIISGDMSFVGARPEVPKYVERYTDRMMATLLLPAGVTSEASIEFRDEEKFIYDDNKTDEIYVSMVLPRKMEINLKCLFNFSLLEDIKTMFRTLIIIKE